jgi:hypothetical protein
MNCQERKQWKIFVCLFKLFECSLHKYSNRKFDFQQINHSQFFNGFPDNLKYTVREYGPCQLMMQDAF